MSLVKKKRVLRRTFLIFEIRVNTATIEALRGHFPKAIGVAEQSASATVTVVAELVGTPEAIVLRYEYAS